MIPSDVQPRGSRSEPRVDLPERAAARDRVLLPAELADDEFARREAAVVALDHLAHDLTRHHAADRRRLLVGARFAHPRAHVRVEREEVRANEHLARARLGERRLDEGEVRLLRKADGPSRERDLAIRHGPSFSRAGSIRGDRCHQVMIMEPAGLEPATFWLPARRSPS